MKRLFALIAVSGALAVAACEDPRPVENEFVGPPVEEPMAPAAEDVAAPTDAVAPPPAAPTDSTTLPPEKRTSEQSVQPESETLFY